MSAREPTDRELSKLAQLVAEDAMRLPTPERRRLLAKMHSAIGPDGRAWMCDRLGADDYARLVKLIGAPA